MANTGQVQDYMTWIPHAVDVGQSVADALGRMSLLDVGHLPVVESGHLMGMVAARELVRVSEVVGFDSQAVPVGDVMRADVCSAAPQDAMCDVVSEMARLHADCCAVVEEGRVLGILTTTDALGVLAGLLGGPAHARPSMRPSQVRARILGEHTLLRGLFMDIEQLASRATEDVEDEQAEGMLRERCRELQRTLLRHIELENALLAPALRETDGFGKERADQLLAEHAIQSADLAVLPQYISSVSARDLALHVASLIEHLRADMAHEERALLNADLLRDDVIDIAGTG